MITFSKCWHGAELTGEKRRSLVPSRSLHQCQTESRKLHVRNRPWIVPFRAILRRACLFWLDYRQFDDMIWYSGSNYHFRESVLLYLRHVRRYTSEVQLNNYQINTIPRTMAIEFPSSMLLVSLSWISCRFSLWSFFLALLLLLPFRSLVHMEKPLNTM